MKLAGARALAYCEKPKPSDKAVLIFGSDPGLVGAMADTLILGRFRNIDPADITRMNEDDLKRDDVRLADELVARSMFGGDRVVRLRMEKEVQAKLIVDIIADIDASIMHPEAYFVIEARDLNKTSKIRTAFENATSALALHLYSDDEQSIADFIAAKLDEAGIEIEPDALSALARELPGDRRLAMSEVEKLILYALDIGRPITVTDVGLISSAEQAQGADAASDAAIAGDLSAAMQAMDRFIEAGGSPISAMRTLHFRMLRVLDARSMDQPSGRRLRPPIFDKEWPAYAAAIKDWNGPKIQRALAQLYSAERACKQAGAASEAILATLLMTIAKRSA